VLEKEQQTPKKVRYPHNTDLDPQLVWQREPQIIIKTDERKVIHERERKRKLTAKSIGWV
jgi:hypothetical protein